MERLASPALRAGRGPCLRCLVNCAHNALAKAPPQVTIAQDAKALAVPDFDADPVAVVPQDAEIELTGEVAPGFLAVYYDGYAVWVPAQYLSLGNRPGYRYRREGWRHVAARCSHA